MVPVDIVIPVYRNVDLARRCIESLARSIGEIGRFDPRIVVVNDSPDDGAVSAYLRDAREACVIDHLIENEQNVGFVKSVNRGLAEARARGASALLVNSDTQTFPGTLREIMEVSALDPQIGFVSPRSNNASLCTFPQTPHNRSGATVDPALCHETWQAVSPFLPRMSFVPTAVGFYMLIAGAVLRNFGELDEAFGVGYEEENDLVMRANKFGYRAVLANHAYAYHAGSASFLLKDMDLQAQRAGNLAKLEERHPEFVPLVRLYEASPEFRAERMLRNLVRDEQGRLDLVLNCLDLGTHHNGTSELAANVIRAMDRLASDRFSVTVLMKPAVAAFLGLDGLSNVRVTGAVTDSYAIAIIFGQPYQPATLETMDSLAPIHVFGMLDPISWDCGYLRIEQKIDTIWRSALRHGNGHIYISQFGRHLFRNRFGFLEDARSYARLLPTKLSCYEKSRGAARPAHRHIFIAGNHFRHKASAECAATLADMFPSLHFVTMADGASRHGNVTVLRSGELSDAQMAETLAASSVFVLPSYYEGFGFSIVHALAMGKPVVARDIPPTREILASYRSVSGVFLFSNDQEMADALRDALSVRVSRIDDAEAPDWTDWTRGLLAFLEELLDPADVYDRLVERTIFHDALRKIDADGDAWPVRTGEDVGRAGARYRYRALAALPDDKFVEFLYTGILGRRPDAAGFRHHMKLLTQGAERRMLIDSFLSSPEWRSSGRKVSISGMRKGPWSRSRKWLATKLGNS